MESVKIESIRDIKQVKPDEAKDKIVDFSNEQYTEDQYIKKEKQRMFYFRDGTLLHKATKEEMNEAIKLYAECKLEIPSKHFYSLEDPLEWYDEREYLMNGLDNLYVNFDKLNSDLQNDIKTNIYYKYMRYMYDLCKKYAS